MAVLYIGVAIHFLLARRDAVMEDVDFANAEDDGASQEQIAALPVTDFLHGSLGKDLSCAICLSNYRIRASLRQLPCGHMFHQSCADTWLRRSKQCPLCRSAIDSTVESEFDMHLGAPPRALETSTRT